MAAIVRPRRAKVCKRRLQSRPAMSTVIRLSVIKNICAPRIRELVPAGKLPYKCEWPCKVSPRPASHTVGPLAVGLFFMEDCATRTGLR